MRVKVGEIVRVVDRRAPAGQMDGLDAVPVRAALAAEVPLADQACAVASAGEVAREGHRARREFVGVADVAFRVGEHAVAVGLEAGEHRGALGCADGGVGIGLGEAHSRGRQCVDVRRAADGGAVAGKRVVALLVSDD